MLKKVGDYVIVLMTLAKVVHYVSEIPGYLCCKKVWDSSIDAYGKS